MGLYTDVHTVAWSSRPRLFLRGTATKCHQHAPYPASCSVGIAKKYFVTIAHQPSTIHQKIVQPNKIPRNIADLTDTYNPYPPSSNNCPSALTSPLRIYILKGKKSGTHRTFHIYILFFSPSSPKSSRFHEGRNRAYTSPAHLSPAPLSQTKLGWYLA